jgi:hypothetical protein
MVAHFHGPGSRVSRAAGRLALLLAGLLPLALARPANAQHVRGRLIDLATGDPIPVGLLSLLSPDSVTITKVVTDAAGNWRLDVPRAGMYRIGASRLGYEAWISELVQIDADAELNSEFRLRPLPVRLDPINVRARGLREYLDYSGFYERQRGNFGHFVTPEDVDRRQASRVTDLLVAIPGVQRVYVTGGSVGPSQIQLRGSSLSQGGACRPRVFVDGLMYSRGDSRPLRRRDGQATEEEVDDLARRMDEALSLDDIGHPSTIAGIEVYRSASQVPVQFGGTSVETLCGVIVIWTRTGRMRVSGL